MAASNIIKLTGARELPPRASRAIRREMDTLEVTPEVAARWRKPDFQRELRVTPKVRRIVLEIRKTQIIPGILTLGVWEGNTYLVDGQHRCEAFRLACDPDFRCFDEPEERDLVGKKGPEVPPIAVAYADVRIGYFDSMEAMSDEFLDLNSALVRMKLDDFLRGLEATNPHLAAIRRACPFVGYDRVRTSEGRLLLSMASAIRVWFGSAGSCPNSGPGSTDAAKMLDAGQVRDLTDFLKACYEAWGRDKGNYRLWGMLNLGVLMWLWRRSVLGQGQDSGSRATRIGREDFIRCLMALSASQRYVDWLGGRLLKDRDRSPCYAKIRDLFSNRLVEAGHKKPRFPQDDWAKS